jgi:hypothetical protein
LAINLSWNIALIGATPVPIPTDQTQSLAVGMLQPPLFNLQATLVLAAYLDKKVELSPDLYLPDGVVQSSNTIQS